MEDQDFKVQVIERLATLETKLDSFVETRDREIKDLKDAKFDHETRIRPLETTRTKVLVIIAIVSTVLGLVGGGIMKLVFWLFSGHNVGGV